LKNETEEKFIMEIKKINVLYFSPTGTTRKAVEAIAEGIAQSMGVPVTEYDYTRLKDGPQPAPAFGPDELLLVGLPVYVGRIPTVILPYLEALKGNNTPCVPLGVYGNRHYDDYLVELEDLLRARGFLPVGAAAFIGEHSFSDKLGGGRPNAEDLDLARNFGKNIGAKLARSPETPVLAEGCIPGHRPYRVFRKMSDNPPVPELSSACTNCLRCAEACPTGAISAQGPQSIDNKKCIRCRSCARACPVKAIEFAYPNYAEHRDMLVKTYGPVYNTPVIIL
jgi:ferredoxin